MIKMKDKEFEEIKKRMSLMKEEYRRLHETKVFKKQGAMFKSWVSLASVPTKVYCPIHKKYEKIVLECGLDIETAEGKLVEEIEKNYKKVKKEHQRIKQEMITEV